MYVKINHLQVTYGHQEQPALHIKTPIAIGKGERIGIIGSNGAGKTTFVKALLGLVPYKGTIQTDLEPWEMAAHLQFNEYANTMPVRYIMEAILNTSIKKNKQLQELISYFDFRSCLRKRYHSLSGGQKQRFTIILVMMQDAPLTFYDEVTSGLDFETRQKLMERLSKWYENKKSTLCIVSHYYEELQLLADKILILDKGNVVDFGEKDALFEKYCGNSVIIVDNSEENRQLLNGFRKLFSPEHLIAIPCQRREEEQQTAELLITNDVNFRRSNNDIELMSMNAKAAYYEQNGGLSNEKINQ